MPGGVHARDSRCLWPGSSSVHGVENNPELPRSQGCWCKHRPCLLCWDGVRWQEARWIPRRIKNLVL